MNKSVVELFAGVGGFRVGLERLINEDIRWETVFANQFEPSTSNQFAFDCYCRHFGHTDSNNNQSISDIPATAIPDHTLLVGGFPCQDYSVASTGAKGLEGKKGVLWWDIHRILKEKQPTFLLLENVDRLLKSPTSQRGRDFAIMLKCLNELEYDVEWRVINAAEYGYPQKRRRVFIFAYKQMVTNHTYLMNDFNFGDSPIDTANNLLNDSYFNNVFEATVDLGKIKFMHDFNFNNVEKFNFTNEFAIDLQYISDNYNEMFRNCGAMRNGHILSFDVNSTPCNKVTPLEDILDDGIIDSEFFLNENQILRMQQAKMGKSIPRFTTDGFTYNYAEGSMSFPDKLDVPGRTMLTSEGTINRSTHVVLDKQRGEYRFITPSEAEKLNGFDVGHTEGMTKRQRYFCMGNALVTGLITEMGREISKIIDEYNEKND